MTTSTNRMARAIRTIAQFARTNSLEPITTYEALVQVFADMLALSDYLDIDPVVAMLEATLAVAAEAGGSIADKYFGKGEVSAQVLRDKPTLVASQTDDLKIDTGLTRYWLARTTVDNGEPYNDRVTIERLISGRWTVVHSYPGAGQ